MWHWFEFFDRRSRHLASCERRRRKWWIDKIASGAWDKIKWDRRPWRTHKTETSCFPERFIASVWELVHICGLVASSSERNLVELGIRKCSQFQLSMPVVPVWSFREMRSARGIWAASDVVGTDINVPGSRLGGVVEGWAVPRVSEEKPEGLGVREMEWLI